MANDGLPKKHGILILHGAGMPEVQETLVGDPLSKIANGLLDHFNRDQFLRARGRITATAKAKEVDTEKRALKYLDIDIFRAGDEGKPERHEHKIRMREVLWKPTMPKQRLGTYLGVVWLWAFGFRSHNLRKTRFEEHDRRARERRQAVFQRPTQADQDKEWRTDWDKGGIKKVIEEGLKKERRWQDFRGRILLALLGLFFTWVWMSLWHYAAGVINERWQPEGSVFMRVWHVATQPPLVQIVIGVSLVAAVLVGFLAWKEEEDRKAEEVKEHSRLHLITMVMTTAWLAVFVAPVLLLGYYLDRAVTLVLLVLVPAAGGIWVSRGFGGWWAPAAFLLMVSFMVWVVLRQGSREFVSELVSTRGRENRRILWVRWLSTLLIAAGAPWVILLISALELLGILPIVGDTFKKWAETISEVSYWNALKDIHCFLTDSSRSAVVRSLVMEGLKKLANEVDSIHIFAHSLGTVVAYDTLAHLRRGDGSCAEEIVEWQPVSIDELCLPTRIAGILKGAGIESAEQLLGQDEELLAIPGFGAKSLEQVRASLKAIEKPSKLCEKIKTLVTYGSPLNKIRILAESPAAKREADCGFDYWRFDSDAKLPRDLGGDGFGWMNFYALEDVASDVCSLYSGEDDPFRPYEFSTWSAKDLVTAHGAYFTDPGFWNSVLQAMGVVYERGEMRRIEKLRIDEDDLRALRGAGVVTQRQLLERGGAPNPREKLCKETGILPGQILDYVNLANLVCVPGMNEETADLLAYVGVDSLEKLRSETPDDLHSRVDAAKDKFRVKAPSPSDVRDWIAEAKKLPDMVTPLDPTEA